MMTRDTTPRNFNPMLVPGLSAKAQEAVNEAFEAMSTWRTEIAENGEKNIKRVIDKMAAGAAAVGWPEQIVDATRSQMQALAEVQIKAIDHLMDAWEEQLKSPNPTTASPGMLSKLQSPPSISGAGVWPGGAIF